MSRGSVGMGVGTLSTELRLLEEEAEDDNGLSGGEEIEIVG